MTRTRHLAVVGVLLVLAVVATLWLVSLETGRDIDLRVAWIGLIWILLPTHAGTSTAALNTGVRSLVVAHLVGVGVDVLVLLFLVGWVLG